MLDERVRQGLETVRSRLDAEGGLPSRKQLSSHYDMFRKRFGPEVLSALDGEALLETMHNHSNQDSLVYWLEFKNDDEFPSIWFGSIAGGSALKLGIYRRKETGAWMTGSPQKQQELSIMRFDRIARNCIIESWVAQLSLPIRYNPCFRGFLGSFFDHELRKQGSPTTKFEAGCVQSPIMHFAR